MKKYISAFFLIPCILVFSCKKGPGEGGRASISGKVFAKNYNTAMTYAQDSGYIGDQNVYIVYGDEIGVGDNQDSNHDGSFEFKYLRKGKYKVYVYTKILPNYLDSAIVQEVEITDKKQKVNLPDFKIKTIRN